MAQVTITLRDTPEGSITVQSSYAPAIGSPLTPAQALALDLQSTACHRFYVFKIAGDEAQQQEGGAV